MGTLSGRASSGQREERDARDAAEKEANNKWPEPRERCSRRTCGVSLTPRQARFVAEYLIDLNATQAAIRAGYAAKNARITASQLLTKPNIQAATARGAKRKLTKAEVKADHVLAQIRDIAFGDVRTLFNSDGSLKPLHDLSDDAAALIASFEVDGVSTKKVRIMDRLRALELLAKYLNLLTERVHVSKDVDFIAMVQRVREKFAAGETVGEDDLLNGGVGGGKTH